MVKSTDYLYMFMVFTLLITIAFATGCASTQMDQRRAKVLDCTKGLIEMDSGTIDSYKVCKDLYTRGVK